MARRKKNKKSWQPEEKLKLFATKVQELSNMRLVKSGMNWQFKIKWEASSGHLEYSASNPDREDLRSFLSLFRQFIMNGEPTFVHTIFNDCDKFLKNETIKEEIQKAREDWNSQYNQGDISLIVNDEKLIPNEILNLWINGEFFHNDLEKIEELQRLQNLPIPVHHIQVIRTLPTLTQIIL